MKTFLFVTFLSINLFAAEGLHFKFKVPDPTVADIVEKVILKNCQPSAHYAVELLVHDYRYRKMVDSSGQITLLHDVVVMFDYQGAYEDFVTATIGEIYPQKTFFIKSLVHPDICLQ